MNRVYSYSISFLIFSSGLMLGMERPTNYNARVGQIIISQKKRELERLSSCQSSGKKLKSVAQGTLKRILETSGALSFHNQALADQQDPFNRLPDELLVGILEYLVTAQGPTKQVCLVTALQNIRNAMQVNKKIRTVIKSDLLMSFYAKEMAVRYTMGDSFEVVLRLGHKDGFKNSFMKKLAEEKLYFSTLKQAHLDQAILKKDIYRFRLLIDLGKMHQASYSRYDLSLLSNITRGLDRNETEESRTILGLMIGELLDDRYFDVISCLPAVAGFGSVALMESLIEKGLKLNRLLLSDYGHDALRKAVDANDQSMIDLLISAGAPYKDQRGRCSLIFYALRQGNVNIMKNLLERGVDVNVSDGDIVLIHAAARSGDPDAVALLLNYGASINACCEKYERTPLMAVYMRHPYQEHKASLEWMTRKLLNLDALINERDADGQTALTYASTLKKQLQSYCESTDISIHNYALLNLASLEKR